MNKIITIITNILIPLFQKLSPVLEKLTPILEQNIPLFSQTIGQFCKGKTNYIGAVMIAVGISYLYQDGNSHWGNLMVLLGSSVITLRDTLAKKE